MSNILEQLAAQLGPDAYQKIGQQLGINSQQSQAAVQTALPILIGALARNAQKPQEAEAIAGALDRDHDGSLLNNLGSFLNSPDRNAGAGILGHVLGGQKGKVEEYVAKSSGLNSNNSAALLEMLAPLVMASLGQQKKSQGLDASGIAGLLGGVLGGKSSTGGQVPIQQLLNSLLDSNKDGKISDDLLRMGGKMLGGMFKKS